MLDINEYLGGFSGKRAAVLGIGVSNTPLIDILLKAGVAVTACDRKTSVQLGTIADDLLARGAELKLGEDYLENLDFDVIFRTPGMRPDLPQLIRAAENGAVITSEMEVFFKVCPCPIIGVTGSDGKTTTTTIICELLRAAGRTVHLGGNIGTPLLPKVGEMAESDIAVVELSSFQLMTMSVSPHIAVITNITPNHLDMHKSMDEYVAAKKNIFLFQSESDRLIVNASNDLTSVFVPNRGVELLKFSLHSPVTDGMYFDGEAIRRVHGGKTEVIMRRDEIKLPGIHNVDNYMAAFAATTDIVDADIWRRVAMEFTGVEHRIELVRELEGIRYYNDSIASSPTRTIAGLRSFDQKVILIAGGYDKKIPFGELGEEINSRVSTLILCGDTSEKIRESVEDAGNFGDVRIYQCNNMNECVSLARSVAGEGDVVILSPACASFDRYPNFMERGRDFKNIVMSLE